MSLDIIYCYFVAIITFERHFTDNDDQLGSRKYYPIDRNIDTIVG